MKKTISTIIVLSIFFIGCMKPPKVEKTVTIATNETAFLIPLEGQTQEGQQKFMSIEYLNQAKVATKRITLPQRAKKIGRWGHNIMWIPTMTVIRVNRSPVTREWTKTENTGTSKAVEAIFVESKDSIGFSIGVNITGMIKEEDASKFLYLFAGKSLASIIDENIRGDVSAFLSQEFGSRNLAQCKTDKKDIQKKLKATLENKYIEMGITITNIGIVGGLTYEDTEIQKSINNAYIAEMSIEQSKQEMEAEKFRNERKISIAVAERKSAEEFAKVYQAMVKKMELDIAMKKADALFVASQNWNGATPSQILPQGSGFLFGLDK